MTIHPTALVSAQAQIADDVEIGPNVIIGSEVSLGKGCVVNGMAVIDGKTTIGEYNFIGYGAVLGSAPQDFAFKDEDKSELRVGKRNTFREYVTIHRGSKVGSATVVGDDCCTISNNCLLGGYVEIGDGTVLGAGSAFHQFLRVGPLAVVSSGARSRKDIPPYVLVSANNILSGINTIGLLDAGWTAAAQTEIQRAFMLVYGSQLNISQALQKSKETSWSPEASAFFDFIASSKRGVCGGKRWKRSAP